MSSFNPDIKNIIEKKIRERLELIMELMDKRGYNLLEQEKMKILDRYDDDMKYVQDAADIEQVYDGAINKMDLNTGCMKNKENEELFTELKRDMVEICVIAEENNEELDVVAGYVQNRFNNKNEEIEELIDKEKEEQKELPSYVPNMVIGYTREGNEIRVTPDVAAHITPPDKDGNIGIMSDKDLKEYKIDKNMEKNMQEHEK